MNNMTTSKKKTVSEIIIEMAKKRGLSQKDLAAFIKTSPPALNGRLRNNAFTAEELREFAGMLGFSVEIKDENGNILPDEKPEEFSRIKRMVDGVVVDTSKAVLLCHASMVFDMSLELYKDENGFFIVYRYAEKSTVILVDEKEALRMYSAYGDQTKEKEYFS